jgi:hypothetical protein
MGPPSYMQSVVDPNVVMRRTSVFRIFPIDHPPINSVSAGWTSGPPAAAVTHTRTHSLTLLQNKTRKSHFNLSQTLFQDELLHLYVRKPVAIHKQR